MKINVFPTEKMVKKFIDMFSIQFLHYLKVSFNDDDNTPNRKFKIQL